VAVNRRGREPQPRRQLLDRQYLAFRLWRGFFLMMIIAHPRDVVSYSVDKETKRRVAMAVRLNQAEAM